MGNSIRKYNIPLEQWDLYWQKLQEQKFECYYTGVLLVPEKNLSLDHLLPRSKGGSNEIDNCVWCDRNINAFKNDLTDEEFIRRCKIIAQRF
ncbi:MAG: HNH endonuclease [Chroococcidiopsis sp.]